MSILHTLKTALGNAILRSGRARLRQQLLGLSERQLLDVGFDPELLRQGVDAWPWRPVEGLPARRSDSRQPVFARADVASSPGLMAQHFGVMSTT